MIAPCGGHLVKPILTCKIGGKEILSSLNLLIRMFAGLVMPRVDPTIGR
jgi:hypothetical protein